MKKFIVLAMAAIVTMGITSCDSKTGSVKLTSEVDSVSFIIGKAQGINMKKGMEGQFDTWPQKGNIDAFIAGAYKGLENADDTVFLGKDSQTANAFIIAFFDKLGQVVAIEEKEAGEKFLAENKTKSGVITTESGLQYKVITEGTGEKPKAEDMVSLHYTGKFVDGTVFQSSVGGDPLQMPAGGFVPGFTEGLLLMPVGSKYILYIPSDIAYGANPPQGIKPNATLEFELELLEIVKQ